MLIRQGPRWTWQKIFSISHTILPANLIEVAACYYNAFIDADSSIEAGPSQLEVNGGATLRTWPQRQL